MQIGWSSLRPHDQHCYGDVLAATILWFWLRLRANFIARENRREQKRKQKRILVKPCNYSYQNTAVDWCTDRIFQQPMDWIEREREKNVNNEYKFLIMNDENRNKLALNIIFIVLFKFIYRLFSVAQIPDNLYERMFQFSIYKYRYSVKIEHYMCLVLVVIRSLRLIWSN